jgi:hypothetical protein
MYLRLRGENPVISGKALRRSAASRSMILDPPAMFSLAGEDISSDAPVQQDQLAVDSKRGSNLGGSDSLLQVLEERLVSFR